MQNAGSKNTERHQNHSLTEIYLWDDQNKMVFETNEKRGHIWEYTKKERLWEKQNRVKNVHPSTHIKWKLCLEQDSDNAITVWSLYC
jgi:hypothetical protein